MAFCRQISDQVPIIHLLNDSISRNYTINCRFQKLESEIDDARVWQQFDPDYGSRTGAEGPKLFPRRGGEFPTP